MANAATSSVCSDNCTNTGLLYEYAAGEILEHWNAVAHYFDYQPWIFSIIGSAMVGLSGVLPLLVIPIDEGANLKNGAGATTLKILLSFAVGGLLGDVFLHLLPEAWASKALNINHADGQRSMTCGLWVLTGFLIFIIAEKMFTGDGESNEDSENEAEEASTRDDTKGKNLACFNNNNFHKELENNNCLGLNGTTTTRTKSHLDKLDCTRSLDDGEASMFEKSSGENEPRNGYTTRKITMLSKTNGFVQKSSSFDDYATDLVSRERRNGLSRVSGRNGFVASGREKDRGVDDNEQKSEILSRANDQGKPQGKHISGYLNLMANCIDNFTHGLAVGGSFLVSFRLGALTTFAILIHEIPHEVGDFAILLKSGFNRWDAARAQLMTASGGIFGALVAVMCSGSGIESRTSWILPFTAGGFLHIGLVTVLPELLKETDPKESMKQLGALLSGITVMAILTILCD